jgi:hypothetical protein
MKRFFCSLAAFSAWLLAMAFLPALAVDDVKADEAGFVSIFNGKDISGWKGAEGFWSVVDGLITGETTKEHPAQGNTFLIWRDGGDVDDFELRLSYRISSGNSGIQYRSEEFAPFRIKGYQADFEAGDTYSGFTKKVAAAFSARAAKK